MNDNFDVSLDPPPSSVATSPAQVSCTPPVGRADPGYRFEKADGASERNGNANSHGPGSGLDIWPLADALGQRWGWLVLGGLVGAGLGLCCGLFLWKASVTATAQLIRNDSPTALEVLGAAPAAPQTFASLLRSPALLKRVARQAGGGVTSDSLAANLRVTPERESEVVVVSLSGRDPVATVNLANLYANEAVQFTRELQRQAAALVQQFAGRQLTPIESEIATLNLEARSRTLPIFGTEEGLPMPMVVDKLQLAREELADLLARYTEAHPAVQGQRAKLSALESQLGKPNEAAPAVAKAPPILSALSNRTSRASTMMTGGSNDFEVVRGKLQALENARLGLVTRLRTAQVLQENPPGYYQLLAPATPNGVIKHGRTAKLLFLAAFAGMLGVAASGIGAVGLEIIDDRLKTPADVKRVTRLPLLACAGDFARMSAAAQADWAFRTWAHLQSQLHLSTGRGAICGLTSTRHGEGRSTWVHLLAQAAHQRGFRVLTIVTRPLAGGDGPSVRKFASMGTNGRASPLKSTALTPGMLAAPGEVTKELVATDSQALLHIPLPGWVWDLEQRKRWQAALRHWSQIDNLVIFVELPPASQPETILLAENLPNLVWLTDSGHATATETQEHLQILRDAHCQVAGVVLNHAPSYSLHRRFARWLNVALWFATLQVGLTYEFGASPVGGDAPLPAAPAAPAASTNGQLSAMQSSYRAPWQQRLTLGPGDVLNISLFGERELARSELPIGPDGRISYLEAQDVNAAGATVDELRARLDAELGKFRRAPRTIITPVAFHSKKYFVLGGVTQRGVFPLERPVTVVEAVARARGLETGLSEQTTVEVADLSRSFLAREGKRVPVDFEKLFQTGDLSQNVPLEPGDYLFFPVRPPAEVYVLGEVIYPGVVSFNPELSAISAVGVRGGFNQRAYKKKVLVVRGSLNKPETFIVNASDVLAARSADFKLQPRDIIYVAHRPWLRAEDLLDAAVSSFVQAAVITFGGEYIGPFIK